MTGAGKPQILRKSHADDGCFPDRAATEDGDVRIDAVPYDHPDAVRLTGEVQQEYVIRYGGVDRSPIDPAEFVPPGGLFLVAYAAGAVVGCGGWRAHGSDAEIKRMYVTPSARGRGLARRLLAELERTARAAGHRGSSWRPGASSRRRSPSTGRPVMRTFRPTATTPARRRASTSARFCADAEEARVPWAAGADGPSRPRHGPLRWDDVPDPVRMSVPARRTFRHRALRSDAAANRNRLLAAATVVVKRDGEKVPMATVAGGCRRRRGHPLPALSHPGGAAVGTGRAVPGDRPRRRTAGRREPGPRTRLRCSGSSTMPSSGMVS